MSTVPFTEYQQQPAAVLERVQAGEHLIVVRDSKADQGLRPRGRCAGQFYVPDDFDAELPEDLLREFEGR